MSRKLALIAALVLALGTIAAGIAVAAGGDGENEDERPLTGRTLERATEAALAHTDGGTVVETETGDDGADYGVEVRFDDGRQVEVNLDENFKVIGEEEDEDAPGEKEDDDD